MDFMEKLKDYLDSDRGKQQDFDDLVYNIKGWFKEIVEEKKTLSDKYMVIDVPSYKGNVYPEEDIKEAIKDIKGDIEKAFEEGRQELDYEDPQVIPLDDKQVIDIINKRAGERLT